MIRSQKGIKAAFTLIEMLVTVSIIITLLSVVVVSIDPARRMNQARNAVRWSDVNTILNGIKKYQVDNDGSFPEVIEALPEDEFVQIGSATENVACQGPKTDPFKDSLSLCQQEFAVGESGQSCINLTNLQPYIPKQPIDPKTGSEDFSRYYLQKTSSGLIRVGACDPESEDFGGSGRVRVIEIIN